MRRAAGWYPATVETAAPGRPVGSVLRYWDGRAWTGHVDDVDARPAVPSPRSRRAGDPATVRLDGAVMTAWWPFPAG